jgi:hypothetical protein
MAETLSQSHKHKKQLNTQKKIQKNKTTTVKKDTIHITHNMKAFVAKNNSYLEKT